MNLGGPLIKKGTMDFAKRSIGAINLFQHLDEIEGIPIILLRRLYEAKCIDLKIARLEGQEKRFFDNC
jgi:hypothetical protein